MYVLLGKGEVTAFPEWTWMDFIIDLQLPLIFLPRLGSIFYYQFQSTLLRYLSHNHLTSTKALKL